MKYFVISLVSLLLGAAAVLLVTSKDPENNIYTIDTLKIVDTKTVIQYRDNVADKITIAELQTKIDSLLTEHNLEDVIVIADTITSRGDSLSIAYSYNKKNFKVTVVAPNYLFDKITDAWINFGASVRNQSEGYKEFDYELSLEIVKDNVFRVEGEIERERDEYYYNLESWIKYQKGLFFCSGKYYNVRSKDINYLQADIGLTWQNLYAGLAYQRKGENNEGKIVLGVSRSVFNKVGRIPLQCSIRGEILWFNSFNYELEAEILYKSIFIKAKVYNYDKINYSGKVGFRIYI